MPIRVSITDLQTHIIYRGTFNGSIRRGQSLELALDASPGRVLRIGKLRGWLISDSNQLYYLMGADGKRFKMRPVNKVRMI